MRPRISMRGSVRPYVRPYVRPSVNNYAKPPKNTKKSWKYIVVIYWSITDASICPPGLFILFTTLHAYLSSTCRFSGLSVMLTVLPKYDKWITENTERQTDGQTWSYIHSRSVHGFNVCSCSKSRFWQVFKSKWMDRQTDGRTDGLTDRQTDRWMERPTYWNVRTHLKTGA